MYLLARWAPAGTPLAAALNPSAAWPLEVHALAAGIDAQWKIAWLQGGAQGDEPTRIKRPGEIDYDDATTETDRELEPVEPAVFDEWYRSQFEGMEYEPEPDELAEG